MQNPIPKNIKTLTVHTVDDIVSIKKEVDFVFCALDMEKQAIQDLENAYAEAGIPVVSNNSAHRWTNDVPMIIPEVNPDHLMLIRRQQKNRHWSRGFIVAKPNCSIQSYVPVLKALEDFEPQKVFITTLQAISGSGKMLNACPEIHDNIIPLKGEKNKTQKKPP